VTAPNDLNMPWTEAPNFALRLAQSGLDEATRDKVRFYAENGYLVLDLGIPQFDELARSVIRECSRRSEYPVRLMDAWDEIAEVRRLATLPAVLDLLEVLYRRSPIPMQTLNFGKGTGQKPHSDAFHFNSVPPGFMCGVWIALEDIDEDNGPVVYYPGSHKLPYFDHLHFRGAGSFQHGFDRYAHYEERLESIVAEIGLEPRTLAIPRGHALVWAANLIHGGAPIRDPLRSRHSQVTHYYFADCLYYQPQRSDVFLGRIEWLDKRDVRTGEYIPQMYNGVPVKLRMSARQRIKYVLRRSGVKALLRRAGLRR
jgi:hypothetical protein